MPSARYRQTVVGLGPGRAAGAIRAESSELKANEQYAKKVVDEQRVGLLGPGPTKVTVKVTDKNVEVTAGGRTVRLRVPDDHHGFHGFYFGGHGYASVADVEFK